MKILLVVIFLAIPVLGRAEERLTLHVIPTDGNALLVWDYPLHKIDKIPSWDARGDTPTAFAKATRKAWSHIEKQHPDKKVFLKKVKLERCEYSSGSASQEKKICWYYDFLFTIPDDSRTSRFFMLMDGAIIEPRHMKTKANKAEMATPRKPSD